MLLFKSSILSIFAFMHNFEEAKLLMFIIRWNGQILLHELFPLLSFHSFASNSMIFYILHISPKRIEFHKRKNKVSLLPDLCMPVNRCLRYISHYSMAESKFVPRVSTCTTIRTILSFLKLEHKSNREKTLPFNWLINFYFS